MRGEAGKFPLDERTITTAGKSLARHLAEQSGGPPQIVIGRDTRESGEWITAAFTGGAASEGARCESAAVITTPGVAYLTKTLPADVGVVISASHNPYQDNGIKLFAPSGRKLDESIERRIEADIDAARQDQNDGQAAKINAPAFDDERAVALQAIYLDYLSEQAVPDLRLDGLRIVVDCANGAASRLAPELLTRLGATVLPVHNTPNGRNINLNCGSLHLEELCRQVTTAGADCGVAYDGDADRALFANRRGEIVDGDATLWAMAKYFQQRGELANSCVVATVMSNIGLERALRSINVDLVRTDVGDKYVLEELLRRGAAIGGEQSGHVIFPRQSLAGDGMLTTLYLLRAMRELQQSLEQLTDGFVSYPQILVNVRVREKRAFEDDAEIAAAKQNVEAKLGDKGRLLLRYSGTEPLARVMIEGEDREEIENMAQGLAKIIATRLG